MNAVRPPQSPREGFEHILTTGVGVPHYVWHLDIEVEFDRELRLVEETILQLMGAGVGDPAKIAELMGLDDPRIATTAVVDLMRKGAIVNREDALQLTSLGADILKRALTRESRWYTSLELRHDPYRDELRWWFEDYEHRADRQLKEAGLRPLPAPGELTFQALEGRFREIQDLIAREGLPFEKQEEQKEKRLREVLRVRPLKCYVAYRQAQLEVWYHKGRDEWDWKLIRNNIEDQEVSTKLAELEKEGNVIIPLEERREIVLSKKGQEVHAAVEEAQREPSSSVLDTDQHREALHEAITEARHELIIVSPWLRTAAVDYELISWLQTSLDRHKDLKISIGYGIDGDAKAQKEFAARDQEEALRRLRKLADRVHGRLHIVDVGNTHEKVVICDDRFAIITSFNFLSFNPRAGKGIRREMGYRITDSTIITQVKERIKKALE